LRLYWASPLIVWQCFAWNRQASCAWYRHRALIRPGAPRPAQQCAIGLLACRRLATTSISVARDSRRLTYYAVFVRRAFAGARPWSLAIFCIFKSRSISLRGTRSAAAIMAGDSPECCMRNACSRRNRFNSCPVERVTSVLPIASRNVASSVARVAVEAVADSRLLSNDRRTTAISSLTERNSASQPISASARNTHCPSGLNIQSICIESPFGIGNTGGAGARVQPFTPA